MVLFLKFWLLFVFVDAAVWCGGGGGGMLIVIGAAAEALMVLDEKEEEPFNAEGVIG